jgi:hypothetical protein
MIPADPECSKNNVTTFSISLMIGSSQKEEKYCWMNCGEVSTGSLVLLASPASARPSSRNTASTCTEFKSVSKFSWDYKMIDSVADLGFSSEFFHSGSQIQGQKDSGSRSWIRIKEIKYF